MTWEVDLFGRLRAGAAAAAADTLAVENGARGVRLLVLTDVATNYFTLAGALRQLETVRAISAAQDETLRLVTARQRAGLATPFDVERAQTEASRARAAIPPLETLAAASRHRIAVLIGDQAFNAASITPSTVEPTVPPARANGPAAGVFFELIVLLAGHDVRRRAGNRNAALTLGQTLVPFARGVVGADAADAVSLLQTKPVTVTEVGRQPWIVYGVMKTADAYSPNVAAGETLFTLLGFAGMYFLLGVLFLYLVLRQIDPGCDVSQAGFVVIAFMLTVYVLLDGYDLGVGAISLFVARTDEERAAAQESIGPFWNGNEVWLIAAAGALFALFPKAYTSSFSGFSLPLMVVLWMLMFRGIAMELRERFESRLWHRF